MSALLVGEGDTVSQGQTIGRIGNEGNSTGPHLHFEVRRDGEPVDPLGYVSPP
jgi:murein DD-endopeptidase MepM/ murein hydrolase activator NlpD